MSLQLNRGGEFLADACAGMEDRNADTFAGFLARQLSELQGRIVAEYRLHEASAAQEFVVARPGAGEDDLSSSSFSTCKLDEEAADVHQAAGATGDECPRPNGHDADNPVPLQRAGVSPAPPAAASGGAGGGGGELGAKRAKPLMASWVVADELHSGEPACIEEIRSSALLAPPSSVSLPQGGRRRASVECGRGRRASFDDGVRARRRSSIHSGVSGIKSEGCASSPSRARRKVQLEVEDRSQAPAPGQSAAARMAERWRSAAVRRRAQAEVQVLPAGDESSESEGNRFETLPVWSLTWDARRMSAVHMMSPRQAKLFEEDGKEPEEKHGRLDNFMIKPGSSTNIIWDVIGLLAVAWDCVAVPLVIGFDPPDFFSTTSAPSWMGRVYWTINIAVCFVTGYVDHTGTLVMDRQRIAKRYAKSIWLPLDAFIVSTDWLEIFTTKVGDGMGYHRLGMIFRTLRMIRTVRLLRMVKKFDLTRSLSQHIRSEELQLAAQFVKFPILILLWAHFVACFWYKIGTMGSSSGWVHMQSVEDKGLDLRYVWSLHWALAMFAGETLFHSETFPERFFAVTILFIDFIFSAALISNLTTAMTRFIMISSQHSAQLAQLRRYLVSSGISRPLALRVQRNAQHVMMERKQNVPEESVDLLKVISEPLRVEIHFEIFSSTLMTHPFFADFHEIDPPGIRKACHECVSLVSLSVGDVLFAEGETPTNPRLFFMKGGTTHYMQESQSEPQSVQHPQWMCEPVLWTTWTHCGTLRAASESRLLALDAERFQAICSGSHDGHIRRYAEEYVSALNEREKGELTDLGIADEDMDTALARGFPELHYDPDDDDDVPWESVQLGRRGSTSSWVSAVASGRRFSNGGASSRRNSLNSTGSRRSTNNNTTLLTGGRNTNQWRSGIRSSSKSGTNQGSQWIAQESKVFQIMPFLRRVSSTRTSSASSGALSSGPLRPNGSLFGIFGSSPTGSKSPPASPVAVSAPVLPVGPDVRDPHTPLDSDRPAL